MKLPHDDFAGQPGDPARESPRLNALLALLSSEGTTDADRMAALQWSTLRSHLKARRHWRRGVAAMAAAAGILIAITIGSPVRGYRDPPDRDVASSRALASKAIDLEAAIRAGTVSRPAEATALANGLEIIERAIAETKNAAAFDPSNTMLQAYLRRLEQRRIVALRERVEIAYAGSSGS